MSPPARGPALLLAAVALASCSSGTPGATGRRAAVVTPGVRPVPTTTPDTSPTTTTTTAPAPSTTAASPPTSAPTKSGSPGLAPPSPATGLVVDPVSGPRGTLVRLEVGGCPPPAGGYSGFFADGAALAHPDQPSYRHPVRLSPTANDSATGTYSISPDDSTGRGLFEVLCAGAGNATAAFTVTS